MLVYGFCFVCLGVRLDIEVEGVWGIVGGEGFRGVGGDRLCRILKVIVRRSVFILREKGSYCRVLSRRVI